MSAVVDPLASLRSWDLVVELGGDEYVVVAQPAGVWLPILLNDPFDAAEILPGMLSDEDQERLEVALMEGRVSAREVLDTALEVVALAAGRSWWWTLRLLSVASHSWLLTYGELVGRGLSVASMPLGAVLDALYLVVAPRGMKAEARVQFDRDLETPPPGHAPEIDEDREAANFLALMNQGV